MGIVIVDKRRVHHLGSVPPQIQLWSLDCWYACGQASYPQKGNHTSSDVQIVSILKNNLDLGRNAIQE